MRGHPGAHPVSQIHALIFTAVERAGFKLESRRAPLEVLVIDHADRPSEN
jgi:uncharacterized protein (TIGR03435 family)